MRMQRHGPFFCCVIRHLPRPRPIGACGNWLPIMLSIGDQTFCVMGIFSDWVSGSPLSTTDSAAKAFGLYSIRRFGLFITIVTVHASLSRSVSHTGKSLV